MSRKVPNKGHYDLVSHWLIEAEASRVWAAIADAGTWRVWWPSLCDANELQAGDSTGLGAQWRFVWKSRLLYRLSFSVHIMGLEYPHKLEGEISGDLCGAGKWTLLEESGVCRVKHSWRVEVQKNWMRQLDPIARKAFVWNHNAVMRQGEAGLKALLE